MSLLIPLLWTKAPGVANCLTAAKSLHVPKSSAFNQLRHYKNHQSTQQQQQQQLLWALSAVGSHGATTKIAYQPKHLLTSTPNDVAIANIKHIKRTQLTYRNMSTEQPNRPLVAVSESRRFMIDCFRAVDVPESHAVAMADLLVAADYRGHQSHGMNRLEMYLNDLVSKAAVGDAVPKILKQTPATAWVDGCNGLGAVVGNFCMDLAIEMAKNVGVGWVCAKGSNHYGIAGWYALRAMEHGLVGMSMTNTSPLMAPTRSKTAALGTNPLAVGATAANGDEFLLDMATTAVAVGKIEIQRRKGAALPEGWAQDPDGNVTTDADLAFQTGCLMPLGGAEINSGYKGYGLGAMVDMFCGVMAGANHSTLVRKWSHAGAKDAADLGQVFIALDPNCFAPNFEERLSDFNARLRSCTPTDPNLPVLVAGEKERMTMAAIDKRGGIEYLPNQLNTCHALAERLGVKPLTFV